MARPPTYTICNNCFTILNKNVDEHTDSCPECLSEDIVSCNNYRHVTTNFSQAYATQSLFRNPDKVLRFNSEKAKVESMLWPVQPNEIKVQCHPSHTNKDNLKDLAEGLSCPHKYEQLEKLLKTVENDTNENAYKLRQALGMLANLMRIE